MRLSDFRIGWRVLWQQPAWSAVSILGLSVGFAACFLLLGFLHFSLSFNRETPQAERIQLVKYRPNLMTNASWDELGYAPLREAALRSGLVELASIDSALKLPLRHAGQAHPLRLRVVDAELAGIFSLRAAQGDIQAALTRPEGLALSASAARKMFGAQPALGQLVQAQANTLKVMAVLPDPPANSSLQYQALVGSKSIVWPQAEREQLMNWGLARIWLKLRANADPAQLQAFLQAETDRDSPVAVAKLGVMNTALGGRKPVDIALVSLPALYLDPDLADRGMHQPHGKLSDMYGLSAAGLLIMLLATINYINLATMRTLRRQREIAIRKLMGAGAGRVAALFLAESILAALLAMVLGIGLAWLCQPLLANWLERDLGSLFNPAYCAGALLLAIVAGVAAGAYPAWVALRVHPAQPLASRDSGETQTGLNLRRALTVVQFSAAIGLAATTTAVGWQTWYASHADPGFSTEHLHIIPLPSKASAQSRKAFVEALRREPAIQDAAASLASVDGNFGRRMMKFFKTERGPMLHYDVKTVDAAFFRAYGIQPLAGELFSPQRDQGKGRGVILNAAALKSFGFGKAQDAVGKALPTAAQETVLGVAPDIRHHSLYEKAEPILYELDDGSAAGGIASARSQLASAELARRLQPVWQRYFAEEALALRPAASLFAENYARDRGKAQMLGLASLIAIALAACGVYVLAAYSVQRNQRQIVLRKLHGASNGAIVRLLGREYSLLLALGAVVGLPLGAIAIERYLAEFAERAPMGYWPLLAALLIAMLVALLATGRHMLAGLRLPPVLALRLQET
ncbi:FtsX-like permease family protein [Massilia sp. BJB1822]|uniref:FtsX-like permease family protein n=1 Tax=Massilia sp. BJB1822 TaxID=2744470 RepID=UPI0015942D71|nr:FtsX-like permease family protein [Massilia sp. BJB1822]NVD96815.1 ABC transporter permease [Massilia sp. BJB1822]